MSSEADAAESMGEWGNPKADRKLVDNFGMTVQQVRDFDPQTLDVIRACKFLGLPLKRFEILATQPDSRSRWVEAVARQKKDLIETFPEASKELKEMLEAIRKFALRKCLKPDAPAQLDGSAMGARKSSWWTSWPAILVGGSALAATTVILATAAYLSFGRGQRLSVVPEQAPILPANGTPPSALAANAPAIAPETSSHPTPSTTATPAAPAVRVRFANTFASAKPFQYRWRPNTANLLPRGSLPKGLWAGCYDPHSGGEFRVEVIEGNPAFGLASRSAPGTAQLSILAEDLTGGLQAGRSYSLHFEYLTRGMPGTSIAWIDPKHKVHASVQLAETGGQWKAASLSVQREEGTPLRANIDASKISSDSMLYVRNLSITEDGP